MQNLESGAIFETILLRNEDNTPINSRSNLAYSAKLTPDRVSKQFLENLNISVGGRTPIYVSGDGNCMYHSISVGICGNQSVLSEIRVRTCLELIKNRHAYRNLPNANDLF